MAKRRAYSKEVVETDWFTNMGASAQCLYFHLEMNADDDGFIVNVKTAMVNSHASDDDMQILIAKNFIIKVEDGLYLVKHHLQNNQLKYTNTSPFADRLVKFSIKRDGSYTNYTESLPCAYKRKRGGETEEGGGREETIEEEEKRKGSGSEGASPVLNQNQKINALTRGNGYQDNKSPLQDEVTKRAIEIAKTKWIEEDE